MLPHVLSSLINPIVSHTTRSMKTNVEGMNDKMEHLLAAVSTISIKSDEVNATLSARRENIEELNGVRALLTKLQVRGGSYELAEWRYKLAGWRYELAG